MALSAPPTRVAHHRVGERPERAASPVELIGHLSDAWTLAAAAHTLGDALSSLGESARACIGARTVAATLEPRGTRDHGPSSAATLSRWSVEVPVSAASGQRLGVLRFERAVRSAPFSAEDEAVLGAFALMAAVRMEQLMFQRNVQAVLDSAPAAVFLKDRDLRYLVANRRAAELVGRTRGDDILGRRDDELLPAADARRVMASDQTILDGHGDVDDEQPAHWPLVGRQFHVHAFSVPGEDGTTMGVGGVVSDITAHRTVQTALAASEAQYRLLFEYALDAILVADDTGRYVEANPAACMLLDMSRDDILAGQPLDIVIDDLSPPGIDPATPRVVRVRRGDGSSREAEFTAVDDVAPGRHLSILRDVTVSRASERRTQQRQAILDSLLQLPAGADLHEQAAAVCDAIVHAGLAQHSAIVAIDGPRRIAVLGAVLATSGSPAGLPATIEGDRVARIATKALGGPWVDAWPDGGQPTHTILDSLGLAAVAWAPLHADGRVIGLLGVGGSGSSAELAECLPDVAELASVVAGSRLGHALRERAATGVARTRIQRLIDTRAFRPVFQAIVDLESREPLGYEALTRFDDAAPPDVVFQQAADAGLSLELQVATAELAMQAAGPLPANRYISINVSPELIVAREPLRTMLRSWGFGVVLEITEHVAVSDYDEVRRAIAEIGAHVRLAVDDAGAGFASLRHILELRPAMVKLDRSLVAGIDQDPARQALVAGMAHFATRLDFELMAEGVEEEAERTTLLELGVRRAQGYLFGRPAAAESLGRGS
jgi:PAS domain S-box-containing protein